MDIADSIIYHPSFNNRWTWHHCFRQCRICQSKLMAYLDAGHTFDEIVVKLSEKHPDIKNPRIYARNAIRETTGEGIFDDYIFEHHLWNLRNPILAPPEIHEALTRKWTELAAEGRMHIELEKKIDQAIQDPEKGEIFEYIFSRQKDSKRR